MKSAPLASATVLRQRWFLVGLSLFFLAISLNYYFKIHATDRETRSAFKRWQSQILEIDQGENIWAKHVYPNPPVMVLILKPLADLPQVWGSMSWLFLKVLMTILAIHWVFTLLEQQDRPFPLWGKLLVLLLVLRPVQGDLMHGNVNLFILFLVVGSLYAYCRGRDLLSGIAMGLAIACKVTPALFVPYFVWKKGWKVLAGCAAGLVLFLLLVPALFMGWEKNQQGLKSWFDNMIVPFVIKGDVTPEHHNQSLPGLAVRLLSDSPSFTTFVDNVYTPVEYHNVASLGPTLIRWGLKGCLGLFALLVVWSCRTPAQNRANWRLWAEFSLIALGMLLFSERTWKHHCVMLLLPFAVLGYVLSTRWHDKALRNYLLGTIILVLLLMSSTATGLFDRQDRVGKLAQVYGAYVWSYLLLMASMVVILKRKEVTDGEEKYSIGFQANQFPV